MMRIQYAGGAIWPMIGVTICLLTACEPGSQKTTESAWTMPSEPSGAVGTTGKKPNFVIVSIDTARSDFCEWYGHPQPTTPYLSRLSRLGTVFSHVIAQSPWTVPSHWSIFTGKYVSNHGMMTMHHRADDRLRTLAQILTEAGYDTAAFSGGGLLTAHWGFDRGFGTFESLPYGFPRTVPAALNHVKAHQREPFLLFVHGYDVHAPYYAHDMDIEAVRTAYPKQLIDPAAIPEYAVLYEEPDLGIYLKRYSAGYREVDRLLAQLIQELQRNGLMDHTYIIITADHGEEFMAHGGFDHGSVGLYEEAIAVPMVIIGPDIPVNRIESRPVQCIDLFATVLNKAGIPAPTDMDARNLFASELSGSSLPVISETMVFRELVPVMAANYLIDNHTQVWAGRVRSRRTELPIRDAIALEFGEASGNIVEIAPGHLESTFDVETTHFYLCDESGFKGDACFLMIDAYTKNDLELKARMIEAMGCGADA
ncbi:sulfatase, partial [bacterium]|nr:sulfatase [candidate division CSSED10-310 bacterium]